MSQLLIDRSPDLKRLRDEGYEIAIAGAYLLVHHVPYVKATKEIDFGTLVSELTLSGDKTTTPNTHVVYFIGEQPCDNYGQVITSIKNNAAPPKISEDIVPTHLFSNKPKDGYPNYYEKITSYINLIKAPALAIDDSVTEKTFKVIKDEEVQSVFQYMDTNSSRVNVNPVSSKLKGQKIGIIGLGGTGSYILDFVSKTPVHEIHLFDADAFLQHNAFRSPGAASLEKLNAQMKKVDYYTEIYSNIHKGIVPHSCYITEENVSELADMNYVFISIDKNEVKKTIMEYLLKNSISFIDVGMGILNVDDSLLGNLRVTAGTAVKNDHLENRIATVETADNEYNTNIQISELNALNAGFAVVKWKKLYGFYHDFGKEYHSIYSLNETQMASDDFTT